MAKTVQTVKGTTKADVITVAEKSAAVNKKKYSVAASGVTVKAGRGNDTVQITGGNSRKVNGDTGNDTIRALNRYKVVLNGGKGDDTLIGGQISGLTNRSHI